MFSSSNKYKLTLLSKSTNRTYTCINGKLINDKEIYKNINNYENDTDNEFLENNKKNESIFSLNEELCKDENIASLRNEFISLKEELKSFSAMNLPTRKKKLKEYHDVFQKLKEVGYINDKR